MRADNPGGIHRFQALWRRCLIEGANDDSAGIYRQLVDAYREPQRHYHTLGHIEQCLDMFDACRQLAQDADSLELAVWFHDVIFEPDRPDNERRSADFYLQLSHGVHDDERRGLVERLIMATLHDGSTLDDPDAVYMVDIDLSSFGLSWENFFEDSRNLRRESPQLGDAEYYRRKKNFQTCLLDKERFYLSDFFADRLERQARANLERYFEFVDRQLESA